MKLQADLHLHTSQRPEEFVRPDARIVIDRAARQRFQVLSITNHDTLSYSEELAGYARERGILLIPGGGSYYRGEACAPLQPGRAAPWIRTFGDLRRPKGPGWLLLAAHPFFPGPTCLLDRQRSARPCWAYPSRRRERTRATSSRRSSGFPRKSSAPASSARTRPGISPRPVAMTMGMKRVSGSALRRRQTSRPSTPGIMMSSRIRGRGRWRGTRGSRPRHRR